MPWIDRRPPPGEYPAHYEYPIRIPYPDEDAAVDFLLNARKKAIAFRDTMSGFQKLSGKDDRESATYFKEFA